MLAGNHDHGIAAGWIDARLQSEPAGFLGLEQRFAPEQAGPLAQRLAAAAGPARLEFAYPGLWLRDDVYALHGHYSDVHATVPTFERLAAGTMARYVAKLPEHGATADDYEAVLSPLYAWLHALTQRADHTVVTVGGSASASTYEKLTARTATSARAGSRSASATARRCSRSTAPGSGRWRPACRPGAAPRLPARHPGGDRAPRHPRRARDLGPLAPVRAVARRRRRRSGPRPPAHASSTPARGSTSGTSSARIRTARRTGPGRR